MFGLNERASKKLAKAFNGFVTLVSSASIVLSSVSVSFAQQIIVDPSAPGTSFLATGNGTPQVNIATPQSGVSVNQFGSFNVGAEGLVLNNSKTNGVSVIGQNVTANPNLMVSGPATTIVNEVTGAAPSSLVGKTEVFGQAAAVIIANPNGISCNGCEFLNSTSSTLTTGKPIVNGARVDLLVEKGTVTVGPNGFKPGKQGGVFGRHVVIDGPVATTNTGIANSLVISGGAQRVQGLDTERLYRTPTVAAPSTSAKTSPFAVDITENGKLTAGELRIRGNEAGQGVNLYGDIKARAMSAASAGNLFYKNIDVRTWASLQGRDVRQYGDLTATRNIEINSDRFTLYNGRKIRTGTAGAGQPTNSNGDKVGNVTVRANEFVVIAGEVSAENIDIRVNDGSLTNNGFLMADGDLTIFAKESVTQERKIAREYDVYFDPALKQYLSAYYAQLVAGGAQADIAAEMIARAEKHELIAEYIDKGASTSGTNVTVTAKDGTITNAGGAVAATKDVRLTAGADIINTYLALRSKLNAEDGCSAENCGYRTDFHAGEILAGNDLSLVAARDIRNEASDIAAAKKVTLQAGRDVIHALQNSNHVVSKDLEKTTSEEYEALVCTRSGGKDDECWSWDRVTRVRTKTDRWTETDEQNILAPARIVSLYDDVDLTIGRDFISSGSQVSAGKDLSIEAGGAITLASFTDDEDDFIMRHGQRIDLGQTCGKEGCTKNYRIGSVREDDGRRLVTATTELVGRSIKVKSKENLTILGARFFAAADLDLSSTDGSMLIDSTDLPDTIKLERSSGTNLVELTDDVVGQIFGKKSLDADVRALRQYYSSLLTDGAVTYRTGKTLIDGGAKLVLQKAIANWRKEKAKQGTPPTISAMLEALKGDDQQRAAMAKSILRLTANALDKSAKDGGKEELNGYALLSDLINSGASEEVLQKSALLLVDDLIAKLAVSTAAIETANPSNLTFAELTEDRQSKLIFDQVHSSLTAALPSGSDATEVTKFERLSVKEEFVKDVVLKLANQVATELGHEKLFETAEEAKDALLKLESSPDLQRVILEMSLILSPGAESAAPDIGTLRDLVHSATTEDENLKKIAKELGEFKPVLLKAVKDLIKQRDIDEQAERVLAQNVDAAGLDVTKRNILVLQVAEGLGRKAARDRRETVASNTANYVDLLQDNDLLLSVEALRRAKTGDQIKDAVKSVGVQSFVSLIDSDALKNLRAEANTALEGIRTSTGAQLDAHYSALSDYHAATRTELAKLTALVDGTQAERNQEVQRKIALINGAYSSAVASADAAYQQALAANEAQYGHLLTKRELRSRRIESGKAEGWTTYYYVTVPNPYYVNLKNQADQNAANERASAINTAETTKQLATAEARALATDAGLAAQIGTLKSNYQAELAARGAQQSQIVASLNSAITDANAKIALILDQEAIEAATRNQAIAKGSIVEGEKSLSSALIAGEFGNLDNLAISSYETAMVRRAAEDSSKWSDAIALQYLASHKDLSVVVLNGVPKAEWANWARNHWKTQGRFEGREVTFDALSYVATYSDLRAAFASTQRGSLAGSPEDIEVRGATHYIEHVQSGSENRPVSFSVESYLKNYADVRRVFKRDYRRAAIHYLQYGVFEGRTPNLQDDAISNEELRLSRLLNPEAEKKHDFIKATAWRFATHKAAEGQQHRNKFWTQSDLSILAQKGVLLGMTDMNAFGRLNVTSLGSVIAKSAKLSGSQVDLSSGGTLTASGLGVQATADVNILSAGAINVSGLGRTYNNKTGFENIVGTLAGAKWADQRVGAVGAGTRIMVSQELSNLKVGNDLTISTIGDLTLGGVVANVAGDLSLTTKKNLTFSAPRSVIEYHAGDDRNGTDLWDVRSHASDLTVKGDFSAMAGDKAVLEGTKIAAGGKFNLAATNDVTISAAQNIYEYKHRTYRRSLLKKKSTQHEIARLIYAGADLKASGDLSVESEKGNLTTAGGRFESTSGDVNLSATKGNVLAGAYTDVDRETYQYRKSSFFGLISSDGNSLVDHRNATGTTAIADLDLTIVSGGDTKLVGAQLSAGRNLNLNVGGDLKVLAAVSSKRKEFFESKVGAILATTKTERSAKETAVLTTLNAKGEMSISVGGQTYVTLYKRDGEDGKSAAELYPKELTALTNIILMDEKLLDEYFYDETKSLSPAFTAILSVVLTAGFSSYITAAQVPGLTTTAANGTVSLTHAGKAVAAFASSSTVGSLNGVVSGEFDLGDILKNAALSAGTQFLTSAVNLKMAGDLEGEALAKATAADLREAATSLKTVSLLGGQWSEGLSKSLFGNNNLTVANVLEGAFDASVSAGISSAVDGTSFRKGFSSSLVKSVVALGLADTQNEIGNIFEQGKNGGEGSVGHVILHGIAGCAAAEAQGANCAAGAAGGMSQAIYAGSLKPNMSADDRKAALERANLIGAFVGYFISKGQAENVSVAASIAQSGLANNYLSHDEINNLQKELGKCVKSADFASCKSTVLNKYIKTSKKNEQLLAACANDQCRATHLARVAVAEGVFHDIVLYVSGLEGAQLAALQYGEAEKVGWSKSLNEAFVVKLRSETAKTLCSGSVSSCDISVRTELERWGALNETELAQLNDERIDIVTAAVKKAREKVAKDVCTAFMSAQTCSEVVNVEIERLRKRGNRIGGGIDVLFGAGELVGAGYVCVQSAGLACATAAATAGVHGADTLIAGTRTLFAGEKTATLGAKLLMQTGMTQAQATLAYDLMIVGASLGTVKALAAEGGDAALRRALKDHWKKTGGTTNRTLPDGYRVVDDSIGAARPTLNGGNRWVIDNNGNAIVQRPNGTFATSRTEIDNIVASPSGMINTDFPQVRTTVGQKQYRHIQGRKEYRGGGTLASKADAQRVLDAYHTGDAVIIGQTKGGFPIVRFNGVTGINNNVGAGITNQQTNVFIVKGYTSPSIVPTNPNWTP